MPELLEAELYAEALLPSIGERIERIVIADPRTVRGCRESLEAVAGSTVAGVGRIGKVVVLHAGDVEVALRFGMTGRLSVDGVSPIERLEYEAARGSPDWDRMTMLIGGQSVTLVDQRCLGSVEASPDLSGLGPNADWVGVDELRGRLERTRRAIKAALLDQSVVAGLGNLLVDEILFEAAISPTRQSIDVASHALGRLHEAIDAVITTQRRRGGSHAGPLFPHRTAGALCPQCGGPITKTRVAGRTTWYCTSHQR